MDIQNVMIMKDEQTVFLFEAFSDHVICFVCSDPTCCCITKGNGLWLKAPDKGHSKLSQTLRQLLRVDGKNKAKEEIKSKRDE